jgi:hypothetical protein
MGLPNAGRPACARCERKRPVLTYRLRLDLCPAQGLVTNELEDSFDTRTEDGSAPQDRRPRSTKWWQHV